VAAVREIAGQDKRVVQVVAVLGLLRLLAAQAQYLIEIFKALLAATVYFQLIVLAQAAAVRVQQQQT
jgi:hypothetical protein